MQFRSTQEPKLLKINFKPPLPLFTVGACSKAGGGGKIKVAKGHIGDGKERSVGGLNATSLSPTRVDRRVGNDE